MNTTTNTKQMVVDRPRSRWGWLLALVLLFSANGLFAQAAGGNTGFNLNIGMNMPEEPQRIDTAIRVLFIITLLTVAPSLVMLMTCFTRIIIVFSFLRNALSLQGVPANQIMVGFALFMTFFIMQPVYQRIDADAIKPYSAGAITGTEALDNAKGHAKDFMLRRRAQRTWSFLWVWQRWGPPRWRICQ